MGLLRVAAVAGTASAVSGRVQRNQQQKYAAQDAAAAQAAAPAAAAPAASDEDPMAQVQKLSELYKQGILTEAEFTAAKAKALGI